MTLRVPVWNGIDEWRAEAARVHLAADGIDATGTQIGADYRLDYQLDARDDWRTRSFTVAIAKETGERSVELAHDGDGRWTIDGDEAPHLAGALDCDLGLSPLTNLMPVRRHALHEREGTVDIVAAWVSVPELTVHASAQRYEHIRSGVVRFVDPGLHQGFTAELELDEDGLVVLYPDLARRATPTPSRVPRSPS